MLALPVAAYSRVHTPRARLQRETTSRLYRPELDAIRFFLFLGVLFHHAVENAAGQSWARRPQLASLINALHDAGGFALSFFFFLSAYLITSLLQMEKQRTGTVDLTRFYLRRMLRLWPLYIGYLALVCVLHLLLRDFPVKPAAVGAMLLFSGNWYWIAAGSFPGMVLFHLWSISVEEQFYVLFPALTRHLSVERLQQGCLALCAVSLTFTWVLVSAHALVINVWTNSLAESLFFASGALFALRSPIAVHHKSLPRAAAGTLGGLAFWLVAQSAGITNLSHSLNPGAATLAYAGADVGCALLLWGTLQVPTTFLPGPLVYLGRIAYGLYVFHMLVIFGVRRYCAPHISVPGLSFALELAITVCLAALSYELFEKPFLRVKHRFELVHARAA